MVRVINCTSEILYLFEAWELKLLSTSWTQVLSIDLKYQTLDVWVSNGDLAS